VCKWFAIHETITKRCEYRMIVHDADLDEAKPVFIDTIKEEFNNSPDTTYGKESVMGVNNKRSYIKIIQQVMFE